MVINMGKYGHASSAEYLVYHKSIKKTYMNIKIEVSIIQYWMAAHYGNKK